MALTTTTQLLTRLQQEVRDETSTSDTQTRLLARLNEAYLDIVSGGGLLNDSVRGLQSAKTHIFSWAVSQTPIIFNTEAPITSLTSTINKGATALTLSATNAGSLAGWFIKVGNDQEWYRISAHSAGTDAVTLDSAYVNANAAAAETKIVKIDYTIGTDLLLPTNGLVNYFTDAPIPLIHKSQHEKTAVVRDLDQGYPSRAFILLNDPVSKAVTIRFDAYTEEVERFELPYVPFPAALDLAGSNPILPPAHNLILVDHAASLEYDLRDSDSAERYMKRAVDRFKVMKSEDKQFTAYQDADYAKVKAWSKNPGYLKFARSGGHPRGSN